MWPELPLEFNVVGTPLSLQSENRKAREEWKATVLKAALDVIGEGRWAFDETRLAVTIFYFPQSPFTGDLDNRVKLILDALVPNVYLDDELIDRIVIQRFDPIGSFTFRSPSDTLIAAMALEEPVVYMKIAEVSLEDVTG